VEGYRQETGEKERIEGRDERGSEGRVEGDDE
jgi:hypothetical protein